MAEERNPSPVVFLLGAGASADAGCPTVVGMVDGFRGFVDKHDPKCAPALTAILDVLSEWPPVRDQRLLIDVELLLATIRALQERADNFLSPFVRQWKRTVDQCSPNLSQLDRLLQRFIREQCTINPKRVGYLWPIADFIGLYQRLDVFTLNYDAAIEIVCQQKEIPYTDGFDLYWNPAQFDSPRNRLRLFKLHGSLLWYATKGPPRRLVKIPIRATGAHEVKFFTDEEVSDILIYPALSKEQHVEPYATLMAEFRKALSEASIVVAAGCSFRDQYIKQIILERMLLNPELQLVVVDPDAAAMLVRSDTTLSADWTFGAVKHRVSLLESSTRGAFSGHELLRRVRNLSELPVLRTAYESSILSGQSRESQVDHARRYLSSLIETQHVGAMIRVLQDAGSGPYWQAIRLELTRAEFDIIESAPRLFPVMILILAFSRSVTLRREARAWLEGHARWLSQYAVRRVGSGYEPFMAGQQNPQIGHADSFFAEHALRLDESISALERWAGQMEFALPKDVSDDVYHLLADLQLLYDYFYGAQGSNARFKSEDGKRVLPMSKDQDVMTKLGERYDSDGLPLSLLRLLKHAQPRPPKRRS